jgi:hypothetical protein
MLFVIFASVLEHRDMDHRALNDLFDMLDSDISEEEIEALFVKQPQSDVPFTYKLGWWSYQKTLEIADLECAAVNPHLWVCNTKFLTSIRIIGRVSYDNSWRPRIQEIHITENVIKREALNLRGERVHIGEIILQPIVAVECDEAYAGEWIPFDLHQELILQTIG